jgi:preprotein translocase subunit SecG
MVPIEIQTLLTWLFVVGFIVVVTLILAVLLGRGIGAIISDILGWIK